MLIIIYMRITHALTIVIRIMDILWRIYQTYYIAIVSKIKNIYKYIS